jgi:aspartate aminotransferase
MSARVASRCATVSESATVALSDRVKALRAQGIAVIDMGAGDTDFDTPGHVTAAAADALRAGFTHYTASRGVAELRAAISEKLLRDNGITADPATGIMVTPSAKHALFTAMMAILDPGDELLVPSPAWGSYDSMARLAGAVPVFAELSPENDFAITRADLERHVTSRTKALVLNTPNNPTGRVLTEPEADAVAAVAVEHDLLIITDEIYEGIVFGGRNISMASRPDCADRTVTTNGFSKSYAMTGWRLGYAAGPADIVSAMLAIHQHTVACAGSFVQSGGLAALTGPQDALRAMREEYEARARLIVDGLNALPGIVCRPPAGAFFVFPDIRGTGFADDLAFAERLLAEAEVVVTPGSAFGPGGEGHVRMNLSVSQDVIKELLLRLSHFLENHVPASRADPSRMRSR